MADLDIIFYRGEVKVEKFDYQGKTVEASIETIGWSEKNKILSECFVFRNDGTISFNFEAYNRLMLKRMLKGLKVGESVVPPTEINDILLSRLNDSFGSALEKVIPKAFSDLSIDNFFGKELAK